MPYRTKEILELWLQDFTPSRTVGEPARVVIQDGPAGTDTGLVVVPLVNATTSVYVQPCQPGDHHWRVTFEPREDEIELGAEQVAMLGAELLVAAELCAYLEERSAAYVAALAAAAEVVDGAPTTTSASTASDHVDADSGATPTAVPGAGLLA